MGYAAWSDDDYKARSDYRVKNKVSSFDYHDRVIKTTGIKRVHKDLDPNGIIRESRDSKEHPDSVPIIILMDVTGSLGSIPRLLQKKLPTLMGMLIRRGFISHPQILFGAIGDATCDKAPLQVGQFESGLEMDDDLGKFFLEGGGGGQNTESYELAMYFASRKTLCDNFEKRNNRGYCFIIADERPYSHVKKHELKKIIGDNIQDDIPLKDIVNELLDKWDTYILMPSTGGEFHHDRTIKQKWIELFHQHVIEFDPKDVSEIISSIIGASEGFDESDINAGLDDIGSSSSKESVSRAISPILKSGGLDCVTEGSLISSRRKSSLETL